METPTRPVFSRWGTHSFEFNIQKYNRDKEKIHFLTLLFSLRGMIVFAYVFIYKLHINFIQSFESEFIFDKYCNRNLYL